MNQRDGGACANGLTGEFLLGPTERKRRLTRREAFPVLREKFCSHPGFINIDETDLSILLQVGEDVFFWESPVVTSRWEVAGIIQPAVTGMAPGPGRVTRSVILKVILGEDQETDIYDMETIMQISDAFLLSLGDADFIFGAELRPEQKGVRFLLAVAEGAVS